MEKWIKPASGVIVEAVRLTEDNVEAAAAWCRGMLVTEIDPEYPDETQQGINFVAGHGGSVRASLGEYVVLYGGHFFKSLARTFEEVYEPFNPVEPESTNDTRKKLGFSDPFQGRHQI